MAAGNIFFVEKEGLQGMYRYWSHTLGEEGGRHTMTLYDDMFVIDMHECPSAKRIFQEGRDTPLRGLLRTLSLALSPTPYRIRV